MRGVLESVEMLHHVLDKCEQYLQRTKKEEALALASWEAPRNVERFQSIFACLMQENMTCTLSCCTCHLFRTYMTRNFTPRGRSIASGLSLRLACLCIGLFVRLNCINLTVRFALYLLNERTKFPVSLVIRPHSNRSFQCDLSVREPNPCHCLPPSVLATRP